VVSGFGGWERPSGVRKEREGTPADVGARRDSRTRGTLAPGWRILAPGWLEMSGADRDGRLITVFHFFF